MRRIILTILILIFSFCIKEKMSYEIPTQCGKIIYKTEIVEGRTHKSEMNYVTRKRFTVKWRDDSITEKYPTDNDYYHYEVGQSICYERPELLTNYQRASDDGIFCVIVGVILVIFLLGLILDYFELLD